MIWLYTLQQLLVQAIFSEPISLEDCYIKTTVSPNSQGPTARNIHLNALSYFSNTIHFSNQFISTRGNDAHRPIIYNGPAATESLFIVKNSSTNFHSMNFAPGNLAILQIESQSTVLLSSCEGFLLEPVSPFKCSDSNLTLKAVSFQSAFPTMFFPTIVLATGGQTKVDFQSISLANVLSLGDEPLLASPAISFVGLDMVRLSNVSQLHHAYSPYTSSGMFNVSIKSTDISACSNVLSGGIVRNMNDQTTILCLNSTFTHAQNTFQNNPSMTHIETGTVEHTFINCTWTGCSSTTWGGGICSISGNLEVRKCNFYNNTCQGGDRATGQGRGGAIHHNGTGVASCLITECIFVWNNASIAGTLDTNSATSLAVTHSNCSYSTHIDFEGTNGNVGAFHFVDAPNGSLINYLRHQHNFSPTTSGAIDMNRIDGDITFSNIYVENCSAATGGAIIYSEPIGVPTIVWFSCIFIGNTASYKGDNGIIAGNDICFYQPWPHWNNTLKSESSFVNCFSTSDEPRIVHRINKDPPYEYTYHFESTFLNGANYSIRLPDPGIFISYTTGEDTASCGTSSTLKCGTLGYVGNADKIPIDKGTILMDPERYPETQAFSIDSGTTTITSYGREFPVLLIKADAQAYLTKGVGTLEMSYLSFSPSSGNTIILQNKAGHLVVHDCQFERVLDDAETRNDVGMSKPIIHATAGTVTLTSVEFKSIQFGGGCAIQFDSTEALAVTQCTFTTLSGLVASSLLVLPNIASPTLSELTFTSISSSVDGTVLSETLTTGRSFTLTKWECTTCSTTDGHNGAALGLVVEGGSVELSGCSFKQCQSGGFGAVFIDLTGQIGAWDVKFTTLTFGRGTEANTAKAGSDIFFKIKSTQKDALAQDPQLLPYVRSSPTAPQISFIGTELDEISFEYDDDTALSGSILHLVHPYSTNVLSVDGEIGRDHLLCGDVLVPCKTLRHGTDKVVGTLAVSVLGSVEQETTLDLTKDVKYSSDGDAKKSIRLVKDVGITVRASLITLSKLIFTTTVQTLSQSAVTLQSGSLTITNCEFNSLPSLASGSAVSATISSGHSLDILSTSFTSCTTSEKGGALHLSMNGGSFSLGTGVQFTTCTATKGGQNLFVEAADLSQVITSTSMSFIAPTLSTLTATQLPLYSGVNSNKPSDTVPLILYLVPIESKGYASSEGDDVTMCGYQVYPCQSITSVLKMLVANGTKVEGKLSALTVELINTVSLSTLFTFGESDLTISKQTLSLSGAGQLQTSETSHLTLQSLKLIFTSMTATAALLVPTGTLTVDGCTFGDGTNAIPVAVGVVTGGSLALTDSNVFSLVSTSMSLFSVSAGSLNIAPTSTITHSSAERSSSLFSFTGGEVTLSSTAILSNSLSGVTSLITHTGGSLEFKSITCEDITRTIGDGAAISSTPTDDSLTISNSKFISCKTSSGNGGALAVSLSGTASLSVLSTHFNSCSSSLNGGAVFLSLIPSDASQTTWDFNLNGATFGTSSTKNQAEKGSNVYVSGTSFDTAITQTRFPSVTADDKADWNRLWGQDTKRGFSSTLLVDLIDLDSTLLVGETPSLDFIHCGHFGVGCSSLTGGLNNVKTGSSTASLIISSISLSVATPTTLSTNLELTITKNNSLGTNPAVVIGREGIFSVLDGKMIFSNLAFEGVAQLSASLITLNGGSATISECSFKSFNTDSSALIQHTTNTLTISAVTFENILRSSGDGAVVNSIFTSSMSLLIDDITFNNTRTTGKGDGIFISFTDFTHPATLPTFTLKNMKYSANPAQNAAPHYLWIDGRTLDKYFTTADPRFEGSYESEQVLSEWLWSVDLANDLTSSVKFYLVPGSGSVGVDTDGYSVSQCGFFNVWCNTLELGLSRLSALNTEVVVKQSIPLDTTISLTESVKIRSCVSNNRKNWILLQGNHQPTFEPSSWTGSFGQSDEMDGVLVQFPAAEWSHPEQYNPFSLLYLFFTRPAGSFISSNTARSINHPLCGSDTLPCRSVDGGYSLTEEEYMTVKTETSLSAKIVMNGKKLTITGKKGGEILKIEENGQIVDNLDDDADTLTLDQLTVDLSSSSLKSEGVFLIENGRLKMTDISFASSKAIEGILVEVKKGDIDISRVTFSDLILNHPTPLLLQNLTKGFISNLKIQSCTVAHLLSIISSTDVELSNCVFNETSSKTSNILPNSEPVCAWDNSLIHFTDSSASILSSTFSGLTQGVIISTNSVLSLELSAFHDNTVGSVDFPSVRRNIRCVGGALTIGTLSGDGTTDSSKSAWISVENDCVLTTDLFAEGTEYFVPTLDTKKSTASFNKKSSSFAVEIVGETLVPCGLTFEIYALNDDKQIEQTKPIELTSTTTNLLTEKKITLTFTQSELGLDAKKQWRGKLSYGRLGKETDSFLLQLSSSEKKSQAFVKSLAWLIPTIVAVLAFFLILFLVILCRRRNQKKEKKSLSQQEELNEQVVVIKDDFDDFSNPTSLSMIRNNTAEQNERAPVRTVDAVEGGEDNEEEQKKSNVVVEPVLAAIECQGDFAVKKLTRPRTLFDVLHRNEQNGKPCQLDSKKVIEQVVQGLFVASQSNNTEKILTNLSPHKILIDDTGNCFLQVPPTFPSGLSRVSPQHSLTPIPAGSLLSQPSQPQPANSANAKSGLDHFFRHSDQTTAGFPSETVGKAQEDQRWFAPEVADNRPRLDVKRAAVFSLGLILWEMETGLVPFGEVDGINAQRMLGTGTPLLMSHVNPDRVQLIEECLSLDPNARPTLSQIIPKLESSAEKKVEGEKPIANQDIRNLFG
ncbi:hypothetical protein BLNAU_15190 [Blattamonas nauphoetae]|uniref:Protein kinase domain-containing protein n=1 Tax=Blattamonas nauphoetae TaxID=2049346 RepID=A0ABQ9XGX2_9EUKA|nr:hypothetical protein BLNAU_15190 [Blattamonas nauphoetae]